MKKSIKNLLPVFVLLLCVVALSSCNRGYGCPTNFSLDATTLDLSVDMTDEDGLIE